MKISKIEEGVQQALGTLSWYAVKLPRHLSPDDVNVNYLLIRAIDGEDAIDKICGLRTELELYKSQLTAQKCYIKESGEMVWVE